MEAHKIDPAVEDNSFKDKHRFLIFITGSMIISVFIVIVSMTMYNGSGAAQLDLSRPGYVSVRSQATAGDGYLKVYPADGEINANEINNFKSIFNSQVKKLKAIDAFGGSPLSADSLGFSENPFN